MKVYVLTELSGWEETVVGVYPSLEKAAAVCEQVGEWYEEENALELTWICGSRFWRMSEGARGAGATIEEFELEVPGDQ